MIKRILKGIKESLKELKIIKNIAANALYFAVATLYIIDLILDKIYDFIAAFYKSINKRLQKALFYLIIGIAVFGIYREFKEPLINQAIVERVEAKEPELALKIENNGVIETPEEVEAIIEEPIEEACVFDEISCQIKETAQRYGIDYKIAISIAKAEAGNDYSSYAAKYKNNIGGIMYWDTTYNKSLPRTFESLEAGIEYFIANLKYLYFDMGLDTLEEIQPKYCPIGAANDPNNLNINWLRNTKAYYNELVRIESR